MPSITKFVKYGSIYGNLKVLEEGFIKTSEKVLCECICGNKKYITLNYVKIGLTKSCGCLQGKNLKTHGLRRHPLYKIWCGIKERCNNKNSKVYKNYGGRGIYVSDIWEKSFINFYNDMNKTYKKGLQLDRINNDGNYCKENCRWVTSKENNRNRRDNIVYKNKRLIDYCENNGINYKRVLNRIFKQKLSIENALELDGYKYGVNFKSIYQQANK